MLASKLYMSSAVETPPQTEGRDYDVVRQAVRYLSEHREQQPSLAILAKHLGMEPTACHKLFKRWCGLTPKEFLQAITLDHARQMLTQSSNVLEAAHDSGLSGGGRLHDLCINHEAVTPGAIQQRGAGVVFRFGFHHTPFGRAVVLVTERGLAGLSFANEDRGEGAEDALEVYRQRWPAADFLSDEQATQSYVDAVFASLARPGETRPVIRIVLIGTDFEIRVWQALLTVPFAGAASYKTIADEIGKPKATRAVGTAIGHNPISFVVPCHRVLRQDGGLGGYRWGLTRKRAMIGWELGQHKTMHNPGS